MCIFFIEISLATKLLDLSTTYKVSNFISYIKYNTALKNDNPNKKRYMTWYFIFTQFKILYIYILFGLASRW
jgi:hypothetical protein